MTLKEMVVRPAEPDDADEAGGPRCGQLAP